MTGQTQPGLAKALATVQQHLPEIGKAHSANIRTDKGNFSYEYADLTDIAKSLMPLLGAHGLSFIAKPTLQDGQFVLAYSLLHESGEREDGAYPLPAGGNPQAIGSAISYGRRYCLCAVTGVAPGGSDDDGQAASQPAAKPEPEPTRRMGLAVTQAQLSKMHACFNDLGITDRQERLDYTNRVIAREAGHEVTSSKELTKAEAVALINHLDADVTAAVPSLSEPEEGT